MIKNLLAYIPIITISIALISGWVKLNAQSEDSKEDIKVIKTDIKDIVADTEKELKEVRADTANLEKLIEVSQVKQEEINKKVEGVSLKTDKIIDMLINMKQKEE